MRYYYLLLILPLLTALGCRQKQPVDYVNPLIGTGFHGHTYPGATVPYGAVQLSPDTRRANWDACSGYHYSDSTIIGFSHTHLSGTGCIDLGDILVHPEIENIQNRGKGYLCEPIHFSHQNELAQAGYYRVKLDNGILAELTATEHVGIHRYSFPENGNPKLIIDLAHLLDNEKINEAELNLKPGELSGMRCTTGWVPNQYIYFVAQFSVPFQTEFIENGKTATTEKTLKGDNIQAVISFSENKPIVVKVGISSVSIENARLNLQTETPDFNFDHIRNDAQKRWDNALSAYQISGGSPDEMSNFYTALYHSMVVPNQISDANGEYRGADQKIRKANRKVYSTMSLWDTFRCWNPMMTLTDTTLVNNMINSFLLFYDQTGELPIWPLSSGETGTMIGYHSVSVIYDAYSKNIRGYDLEKAFQAMKVSAEKNKKGTSPYLDMGFIPADSKRESVSCLLENAYDDWCIAQMAKSLGHEEDYRQYIRRALFYQNVFNGKDGFFRSRLKNGIWENPFNPLEVGRAYTEATAWQYRFFVPHDVRGLINLLGGTQHFTTALDSLFTVKSNAKEQLSDITGLIGQYAHGNEPSHHMAYLYSFAGQPWKTQQMVRRLLTEMYQPTPEGISGNEDCGQMSAWYVMSSIGLYPVCPGSTQFIFTSPLFENAVIRLANGKDLRITANEPSKNTYINEVYWNNQPVQTNYITYEQLMQGGTLKFVLDSKPNLNHGITPDAFPYSLSKQEEVSIPYISNDISFFKDEVSVNCGTATLGAEIHFTLDGTDPTKNSPKHTEPFVLKSSATVKLRAFKSGIESSAVSSYEASKARLQPAEPLKMSKQGVNYSYYEGDYSKTSEIKIKGKLMANGTCDQPTIRLARIPDHFAFIFSGYINAPEDGVYTFTTRSDDGSVLRIGGQTIVDNDGSHAEIRAMGKVALKKGLHPYELLYFESYEGEALSWSWITPGKQNEEQIPTNNLFIK